MATDPCVYPLFRARYLGAVPHYVAEPAAPRGGDALECSTSGRVPGLEGLSLKSSPSKLGRLDLRALAREDAQPTEVGVRRHKMAAYERKCSEVLSGLFISGEWVAKDLPTLQRNRITHVINCVAALYGPYHAQVCTYKNLWLNDIPEENILCVLHDCFDFIDDARAQGGRVLVHCSQGVSRSATVAIAYCMWKLALSYDEVFDHVKKIRHVVSPNVGFQLELMQWQKRRLQGVKRCYLARLAPQSAQDPLYIVPKAASEHSWTGLDSRGVFIVQVPGRIYVWVGSQAHPLLVRTAGECAHQMCKYDSVVPLSLDAVDEGQEPPPLADALRGGCDAPPQFPQTVAAYSPDFELVGAAAAAPGAVEEPTPRSSRRRGSGPAELGAEAVWESLRSTPRSARSARRIGGGGGGAGPGASPVVPPLQLNTFPISPPVSARTPKS